MSCDSVPPSTSEEVSTSAESRDRYRRTAELCRDKYLAKGLDLSGYNVREMAGDVAEVSKALGYETVQLKGNSFGSFWSLAVIRHYPDLVARATLSALEGPDHTFDRPSAVKTAFETMAEAAEDSERYAERIPEEGLIAAYQAVIDRADAAPIQTSFVDEESGETITMNIDGDALRRFSYGVTRQPVYRYVMHDWPEDLLKIIEGDMSDVAPRLHRYIGGTDADSAAEEIIECSSGISDQRRNDIDDDPARRFVDPPILFDRSMCDLWSEAIVEMDHSDFVTDVPTVLIQGTWDISTPYSDAQTVRNLFTNHHFVTVEGGSHGAIFEAEEQSPEFTQSLYDWYASGDLSSMPQTITLETLSWRGDE